MSVYHGTIGRYMNRIDTVVMNERIKEFEKFVSVFLLFFMELSEYHSTIPVL